jgi:hypothetical protein
MFVVVMLLLIVINSLGYIYTPTASSLFGKGRLEELRQSYVASTKWGYVLTVPVLFTLLLFTAPLVETLYGRQYLGIVLVLQIITVGYLVNPVTGPNYHTLIAAGKMRLIVESFLLNAISNVVLCLLLIPPCGLEGAAVAAAVINHQLTGDAGGLQPFVEVGRNTRRHQVVGAAVDEQEGQSQRADVLAGRGRVQVPPAAHDQLDVLRQAALGAHVGHLQRQVVDAADADEAA